MLKIEQTTFYDPDDKTSGNCVAACIASIFETPIEDIALRGGASFDDILKWTKENKPDLRYNEIELCTNFRKVANEDRWEFDLPDPEIVPEYPSEEFWMAIRISPRGVLKSGSYRGMPIEHAVVMEGNNMVWDPHPKRYQGIGIITGMAWWSENAS